MAVAQQAYEQAVDQIVLAYENPGYLFLDGSYPSTRVRNSLRKLLGISRAVVHDRYINVYKAQPCNAKSRSTGSL